MSSPVAVSSLLDWSNELLATRTFGALSATLARGPALPGESLTGALILVDPRHELRLLLAGEDRMASGAGLRFVEGLASVAPVFTALHAPWSGSYRPADHGLVFGPANGITDLVLMPLPRAVALHGVYAVGAHGAEPGFASLGPAWLQHVGGQALASAERLFQRARLLHAGIVDPLTGWNSRHYFLSRMREQVAASARRQEPATCVVIDVDGLGNLNEAHGHAAGDAVLLEVGNRIEAQARGSDAFAHLGDDAFGVLLPATHIERTVPLIDRVLEALRATPVAHGVGRFEVTVSLGLAGLDPAGLPLGVDRKAVADQWLADAEAALHRAKRAGGDGYAMSGR